MNSFGSSTLQFRLCDPISVRENRLRFRRDLLPLLARANSIYIPTGRWPTRGWILLPRYEYIQLNSYSTTLQLSIGDPTKPNNIGVLQNLSIVQAQCVTRGLASDRNALYLIELTDGRGILHNEWFKFPLTAQYNVRAPAYPQNFYSSSMNGGTPWTWSTMIGDIWGKMSTFLGAYPGLPTTPTGTPEGFHLVGVPALYALCDMLDHIGLTIACDLTKPTNPFSIVDDGATDASLATLQTKYTTNLEDDQEWIDIGAGRVPKTIIVLFKRRNSVYGTEETVRQDTLQWEQTPYYSVSVTALPTFANAVGTHHLWSDFTVRYDMDNQPLAADVTTANTIAAERVTNYFAKAYSGTSGYMAQTYAGALPFVTGSQVDAVAYIQDYRDQSRQGWKTKIERGVYPPFDDIWEI